MDDPIAEGSRLGKMAIQSDGAGDYKQAYYLYQECLKMYVEALKAETQEDRIDWTHEQVLIRFERLAELNAWYKRKNQLESGWLELDDLRDRLETVAPKIATKLRKFSYVPATSVPDTAPANTAGVSPPSQSGGPYQSPAASETQSSSQMSAGGYQSSQATPTMSPHQQQPIPPPQQPVQQQFQPSFPQQQVQPPVQQPQPQQTPINSYPPTAGGIPPNPALYNGTPTGEHDRKASIASSGHQVQPPQRKNRHNS